MLTVTSAIAAPTPQFLAAQFDPVNYSNILAHSLYTRQGMNRLAVVGAQHDLCRDAIFTEFVKAGMQPYLDCFPFQDSNNVTRTACNIVAIKPGVQNPLGEVLIAGGHYDSKNNPGADDNATGVAGLLEMARIFSSYEFAKTIVFVAFDGEEIWDYYGAHRLGSLHFAQQHEQNNITAMVSVDMIGFESETTPNTAWLYGWPSSTSVTNSLASALQRYGGVLVSARNSNPNISDHASFSIRGIPSCLMIEAAYSGNPFYHKLGDYVEQPGNIYWEYAGRMVRGAIGYFAEQLIPVDISPRAEDIGPQTEGAVRVTFAGLPGCRYAIERSVGVRNGAWVTLRTNTATSTGRFELTDTAATTTQMAFYRARFVTGAASAQTEKFYADNAQAKVTGTWSTGSSAPDKYLSDYRFASPGTGESFVEFRPNLPHEGTYEVYEFHSAGSNRTTSAPVDIESLLGTETVYIDQTKDGGKWVYIGTGEFRSGTNGCVRITDAFNPGTGSVVIADAIRFVFLTP